MTPRGSPSSRTAPCACTRPRARCAGSRRALPKRLTGPTGIAHTRWATHGEPSDRNAHPHLDASGRIAVVHNGILENAAELREELEDAGVTFASETDTEVLAHLIALADTDLESAVRAALARVEGTYGLAVLDAREPGRIIAARNGSPVILGIGDKEMFVASDVAALVRHTHQVAYLDDGELAAVDAGGFHASTLDDRARSKPTTEIDWGAEDYDRGGHGHFMRKEILEQPEAVEGTLRGRLEPRFGTAHLGGLQFSTRASCARSGACACSAAARPTTRASSARR